MAEYAFETPASDEVTRLARAKEQARDRLLSIPGVHTVGVGYRRRDGELTDEVCIVVYVDEKLPPERVRPDWLVPEAFAAPDGGDDVRTDVVQRARPVEYTHLPDGSLETRVRPVPGGRSIQGANGGGTLGGWVWDDVNDQPVLLSNNHVLGGTVGADVFQPWGSTAAADKIADNVRTGSLDATIAAPTDAAHVTYEIEGITPGVFEVTQAVLNMPVEKSGATTEHTTGRVVAVGLSGHYGSTNDFEVDPDPGVPKMAFYGDSGSLIVERVNPDPDAGWQRVVGLLWGGIPSENNAFAHQIEDVFADLDLTTICSGVIAQVIDSLFAPRDRRTTTLAVARDHAGRELIEHGPGLLDRHRMERELAVMPRTRLRTSALAGSRRPIGGWVREGWRKVVEVPRHRGLAREVESALRGTPRGEELAAAVQRHRVPLARLAMRPSARRVLEEAAAPFLEGLWSADEVLRMLLDDDDVARLNRALSAVVEQDDGLAELAEQVRGLLDDLPGRSLADVLA